MALLPGSWLPAAEVWTAARRGCDCHFPGPLALRGMAAAAGSSVVEALGRLWQVEALLGRGASAAVFQARCLGEPGVPLTALKEFLPPRSGLLALGGDVDHGFSNERAALEELRGHRNIGEKRGGPGVAGGRGGGQTGKRLRGRIFTAMRACSAWKGGEGLRDICRVSWVFLCSPPPGNLIPLSHKRRVNCISVLSGDEKSLRSIFRVLSREAFVK